MKHALGFLLLGLVIPAIAVFANLFAGSDSKSRVRQAWEGFGTGCAIDILLAVILLLFGGAMALLRP